MSILQWFKSRIRNQKEWFSLSYPTFRLEGTKEKSGVLTLEVRCEGRQIQLIVDRECALEMSKWFQRNYPARLSNVIPINKSLTIVPLLGAETGSEGSPGTSPGEHR